MEYGVVNLEALRFWLEGEKRKLIRYKIKNQISLYHECLGTISTLEKIIKDSTPVNPLNTFLDKL